MTGADESEEAKGDRNASRQRPWQLLLVGNGVDEIGSLESDALAAILDLMPDVPTLTVQTSAGAVRASRDFPSGSHHDVDRLLAEIFAHNPRIASIRFPDHLATPGDPYSSAAGGKLSAIEEAARDGKISGEDAVALVQFLLDRR